MDIDNGVLIYPCPHCDLLITTHINEIACAIFRHGFNIKTQTQISPHESKEQCDAHSANPDIVGCCKPYQIIKNQSEYIVKICDYI